VEASDDPVIERQRRLGQALAEWRKQAELNQAQLARRLTYDRTTVAHAERGAQIPSEEFWRACEQVLGAGGALLNLYHSLQEAKHREAAEAAARARADRRTRLAGMAAEAPLASSWASFHCGGRGAGFDSALVPRGYASLTWLAGARVPVRPTADLVAEQVSPITAQYRLLYHHLPSTDLLCAVTGHLQLLDRLLHRAGEDVRRLLASEVAETAGLAAWLCGEAGDGVGMLGLYRLADDAAELSGERALAGYVRGFYAQMLVERGEVARGLAAFDTALVLAGRGQPRMTAWLAAVQAHALASVGRRAESLQALGWAEREFHRGEAAAAAEWMFGFDTARLAAYRGGCLLRLGDVDEAGLALGEALGALSADCVRRRAEVVLDLAGVRLARGDAEEATRLAAEAVEGFVARGSGSGLGRAERFTVALADAGHVAAARLVHEQILSHSSPS